MKKILMVSFIMYCYGCSVNGNIIGKFSTSNNPYKFEFFQDSTFRFEYTAIEFYEYSTGVWKRTGRNKFDITSHIKDSTLPLQIHTGKNLSNDSNLLIELNLLSKLSLKDYQCRVFLNNELYKSIRCDSLIIIKLPMNTNSIKFNFLRQPVDLSYTSLMTNPLGTSTYDIKPEIGKDFYMKITINDSHFYNRPFNSQRIILHDNYIVFKDCRTNRTFRLKKFLSNNDIFIRYR